MHENFIFIKKDKSKKVLKKSGDIVNLNIMNLKGLNT